MLKRFDDGSYLEIKKVDGRATVSLCSLDPNDSNVISVTSVTLDINDLKKLIEELDK